MGGDTIRIGYFITHFPYKDRINDTEYLKHYMHGGAELTTYYLAKEMAEKRHEFLVRYLEQVDKEIKGLV